MTIPKSTSVLILIIIFVLILVGLIRQISAALSAGNRLDKEAEEVTELQKRNTFLRQKLSEVQKYHYVEEIARNKLNLAKPNETVVIIPEEEIYKVLGQKKQVVEIKLPNWQGWMKLFLP